MQTDRLALLALLEVGDTAVDGVAGRRDAMSSQVVARELPCGGCVEVIALGESLAFFYHRPEEILPTGDDSGVSKRSSYAVWCQ
jgi:hypothetical protein